MKLSTLRRGQQARIHQINASDSLTRKLLEMGLEEGMDVTLLHEGPIARDPIAIRIAGDRVIALRRRDADAIHLSPLS
ncbi:MULTISPECIES: FeoA domain-containing protein [Azospirillaceae]|jgi:ferrous iron transport protein A|uniref:FeoA family protein n=1 Tax=Azospirillaceae TaxID=2829815 RepID=UPI000B6F94BC|nr:MULTISPECIES: FeoA domain-containing protein [Azospirillaceae]MDG5497151.1 FeoA domain-containing protein [Niveispirillum sp. BGYR6]SNT06733.1 Fe2+ transport system protein FeoA [Azospirillum sp. RU38E]SNT21686.1 Fe2+ transport system protein FeoA [Azospirillum sp. RU37A]